MSVEMEIHAEGLPQLREKLERLDSATQQKVSEAMNFEAEAMKTTAQQLAPVKTGRLRASIFAKVEGWVIKIGATASYAIFQELGTRFIQARRFLSHAVELRMQSLINRINRAISEAAREASA